MIAMSRPQQDSPAVCPECGQDVGDVPLETHLRQRHHIYQFRGQRRSFNDTLAFLLQTVCTPPADAEAWRLLEAIGRESYGPRADNFATASVAATLSRLEPARRGLALSAAAAAIGAAPNGAGLVVPLATAADPAGRQLALALAAHASPLPDLVYPSLRLLLQDRRLSPEAQLKAAAA